MTQIEPTYVTFEQAKWLKEKGFNVPTLTYWSKRDGLIENEITLKNHNERGEWSTSRPEQWQVCEWLRVNHGIWVYTYSVAPYIADDEDYPKIVWVSKVQKFKEFDIFIDTDNDLAVNHHHSPQEAYSAAFDYILK
jgi:hypothetical protein